MAQQNPSNQTDLLFYKDADSFFRANAEIGLTYDDMSLNIPLISSDMDTVTESEMAAAMARNGGLGVIHYNMTEKRQIREVAKVKNDVHGLIQDPVAVSADSYIGDVLEMIDMRGFKFHTFPVVDIKNRFMGLLR